MQEHFLVRRTGNNLCLKAAPFAICVKHFHTTCSR